MSEGISSEFLPPIQDVSKKGGEEKITRSRKICDSILRTIKKPFDNLRQRNKGVHGEETQTESPEVNSSETEIVEMTNAAERERIYQLHEEEALKAAMAEREANAESDRENKKLIRVMNIYRSEKKHN